MKTGRIWAARARGRSLLTGTVDLDHDTRWQGWVELDGTVRVNPGVTLTVAPGTAITDGLPASYPQAAAPTPSTTANAPSCATRIRPNLTRRVWHASLWRERCCVTLGAWPTT